MDSVKIYHGLRTAEAEIWVDDARSRRLGVSRAVLDYASHFDWGPGSRIRYRCQAAVAILNDCGLRVDRAMAEQFASHVLYDVSELGFSIGDWMVLAWLHERAVR